MKLFVYTTQTTPPRTGYIQAASLIQAKIIAHKRHPNIKRIQRAGYLQRYKRRLSLKKIHQLTQAITVLIDTGIPVGDAFALLIKQTRDTQQKRCLEQIYTQLSAGESLEHACETAGLPKFYARLIAVGEQSATLPQTFQQLTQYYAKRLQLSKTCTKALRGYPRSFCLRPSLC